MSDAIRSGKSSPSAVDRTDPFHRAARRARVASRTGCSSMPAEDQKFRIVMALIERGDALGDVVERLGADGISSNDVGLVLLDSVARRLSGSAPKQDRTNLGSLRAVLEDLAPIEPQFEIDPILASPILVGSWRSGWRLPAIWRNSPGTSDHPTLSPDLERHVRTGSVGLAVAAHSMGEQWASTRLLLRHSISPVLSLECSPGDQH